MAGDSTVPAVLDDDTARPGEVRKLRVEGGLAFFGSGRFRDDRGFYEEIEIRTSGTDCVQQSGFSVSNRNVIRGIHCSPYGKNVVCTAGEIWDCMVDLRPESPTFMKWDAVLLSPERRSRVYVPPNVGHAFMALKDGSACLYLKYGSFDKAKELEVNPMDPAIGIQWPNPVDGASDFILSAKDRGLPMVADALAAKLQQSSFPQTKGLPPSSDETAAKRKHCAEEVVQSSNKRRCV